MSVSSLYEGINLDNAAERLNEVISLLPDAPDEDKHGRGIVIVVSGISYYINAWVTIYLLRYLGCTLPIQCWYLGSGYHNHAWHELVKRFNCQCINAEDFSHKFHGKINPYALKPIAIMYSPFAEVIYLDADNVPVKNLGYLFDVPEYRETGMFFVADCLYQLPGPEHTCWRAFGIQRHSEVIDKFVVVNSGLMVFNKLSSWKILEIVSWCIGEPQGIYCVPPWYDEPIINCVLIKLGYKFAVGISGGTSITGNTSSGKYRLFRHCDVSGDVVSIHRVSRLWKLSFYDNLYPVECPYTPVCMKALEELKDVWSPASDSLPTAEDKLLIRKWHGKLFAYEINGRFDRNLRLSADGTFWEGSAALERYWTVRSGKLYIAGDSCVTMALSPKGRAWVGQWLVNEKYPVILREVN